MLSTIGAKVSEVELDGGPITSMSALGHKQTFRSAIAMSALPSIADMCGALAYVCFGPKADIGARPSNIRCRVEVRICSCLPQSTDGSSGPAGKGCCIDARL
jgi:hypothetical protein